MPSAWRPVCTSAQPALAFWLLLSLQQGSAYVHVKAKSKGEAAVPGHVCFPPSVRQKLAQKPPTGFGLIGLVRSGHVTTPSCKGSGNIIVTLAKQITTTKSGLSQQGKSGGWDRHVLLFN